MPDPPALSVVHVVPHDRAGGMREVVNLLHARLPDAGVASSILDLDRELRRHGSRGRRLSPASVRLALILLRRWRGEPDSVLAHTVGGALATLPLAAVALVPQRGLVIHAGRELLGAPKALLARVLLRTGVATHVVFVGKAAARSFGALSRSPRAWVIPNGIELPGPEGGPPEGGPPEGGPPSGEQPVALGKGLTVVAASRLVPVKRIDIAVRATMAARGPVSLVVCGDGPERQAVESVAEGSGRVRFLGEVSRARLVAELRAADVFIFPSEVEGLPLVLLEAAACGAALVVRDIPCNREIVGRHAIFVDTDDVGAWADALDRLGDPALRGDLRVGARSRARLFTAERMVAAYADLVRSSRRTVGAA